MTNKCFHEGQEEDIRTEEVDVFWKRLIIETIFDACHRETVGYWT